MDFVITSDVIQSKKHILVKNNEYEIINNIPQNIFVYDKNYIKYNCARTAIFLNGNSFHDYESLEKYFVALKTFDEKISLSLFLPSDVYKNFVIKLIDKIKNGLKNTSYYENYYVPHTILFENLFQAKINKTNLFNHIKNELYKSNTSVLSSFQPNEEGYAKDVKYDRLSIRTGRVKITDGPSILLLKKEYRDIITSRYKNGRIVSIDYSGFEMRVLLNLFGNNKNDIGDDVYEYLSKNIFHNVFTREVIKSAVISLVNGMSENTLAIKLSIDRDEIRKIVKKIKEFFNYNSFEQHLKSNYKNNKIENYYGRVIDVPEERLLVNSYIQSTAVDIALNGFSNIYKNSLNRECVPLFVFHDALIMDIDENCDTTFIESGEYIDGIDGKFPIHMSNF